MKRLSTGSKEERGQAMRRERPWILLNAVLVGIAAGLAELYDWKNVIPAIAAAVGVGIVVRVAWVGVQRLRGERSDPPTT